MSFYAYKFKLSSEIKVYSMFHVNLLQLSKNDSISRQMSSSQFTIIKNEQDLYFVDSINNMKWNTKFMWFELLIKWKKYEQQTWELYTMIKKNASELIKKFHKNHSLQSVSAEWVKNENKQLSLNTWNTRSIVVWK